MEIGSEFCEFDGKLNCNNGDFWKFGKDNKFTVSGRTAIYYILEEIQKSNLIKKAYLPSYICNSMIQPFLDFGIKYNIDYDTDCDIFFAMNYFGYSETNMEKYTKYFKQKGAVILEDITHSILTQKKYSQYSDYLIGSLRKWFPIANGGIAVNVNSKFNINLNYNLKHPKTEIKYKAMSLKKRYLESFNSELKKQYLQDYSEYNSSLNLDYKNYPIDEKSYDIIMKIDIEEIKNKRKENTKIIYEKLKGNLNIKFIENYDEKDCLLFVPIILEKNLRDNLRKFLVEKEVYLPIHWPLEEKLNNIFDQELSLVCDQRYTTKEISDYLDLIINYIGDRNEK